jgi:large subunit ribosomal protein L3
VLEAGPCVVAQVKTLDKDGYEGVQLGFGDIKEKKLIKPMKGHYLKLNIKPRKLLKEFRLEGHSYKTGDEVKADIFETGERVDVTGKSKGKGYQGAIKRHGLGMGPRTHGSKYHRHAGAMSGATSPGKVKKGKRLPGQMGNKRVTTQNLTVVRVDADRNLILVKGAVPGPRKSIVYIKNTVKV